MEQRKSITEFLWPEITTLEGARDAAKQGLASAIFIALGMIVLMIINTIPIYYIAGVVLFGAAGFGIIKMNRIAGVAGVALSVGLLAIVLSYGSLQVLDMLIAAFLLWGFIQGARGAFIYPKVKDLPPPDKTKG